MAHHGGTENTEFFIDFSVPSVPPWLDLCDAELFNQTLTITQYCDISTNLAAKLGAPPVMHSTLKALALLGLGRYGAAWEALQEEVAGQEHPFGGALKDVGTGLYYRELTAYDQAITVFMGAVEKAKQVGRDWLTRWAQEEFARSLVRSGQPGEAKLDQLAQDLAAMDAGLPADVLGDIALYQGKLDEAMRQAAQACAEAEGKSFWAFPPLRALPHVEKSRAETEDGDRRPSYLSALILQIQILLQLSRPGDVIPLTDKGIHIAEEMGYRPLLWRLRAAKAQAMVMLGDGGIAAQEYQAAAVIVRELADSIGDPKLKCTFMSNSSVSSVLERG
jgi:tetratricopeptide (TPR) repeat protein